MANDMEDDGEPDIAGGANSATVASHQLRALVERIERLEEEKAALAEDIRSIYAEGKGAGFDVKTMRRIVRLRKQDEATRKEERALTELYLTALGML